MYFFFWGMLGIMILGGILYCIAGCINSMALVKFLEPTCTLLNLGFAIYGAIFFFGNPFLRVLGGVAKREDFD